MDKRDIRDNNYVVYTISSIESQHYYIGKTNNINQRWKQHLSNSKNKHTFINKWLNKYKDSAKIEILENNLTIYL